VRCGAHVVVLFGACQSPGGKRPGPGPGAPTDSGPGDTSTPPAPAPPGFQNPPEAEDLDPADGSVRFRLEAAPHPVELRGADGEPIPLGEGFAYNGSIPGPTLRAQVGDLVWVDIENQLSVPTTVHWHGLSVPQAADGVPWAMDPIPPGGSLSVQFTVDTPGTAWYHPHFDSEAQVDLGLYGAFVVEDPAEPPVDVELIAILDDWPDELPAAAPEDGHAGGEEETHAHGAHGAEGRWTVNGAEAPLAELVDGQRVRARLINASNAGYVALQEGEVPLLALARDTARLPAPARLAAEVLGPGDRVDLLWTPAGLDATLLDHPWTLEGGAALGDPAPLLRLRSTGGAIAAPAGDWPVGEAAPSPDPGSTDITYVFQGSAHTGVWMINGEVFPEVTIRELPVGEAAVIEVRNVSGTEHPFHLHGMDVEVLSRDGVPSAVRDVQDTVNLAVYEVVRLRVVPPRAGEWMAHCHILPHAHGMMTVLRVTP